MLEFSAVVPFFLKYFADKQILFLNKWLVPDFPQIGCLFTENCVALRSYLSPVPLTLSCSRRHFGFLLTGFELLSSLDNFTSVIFTSWTVPGKEKEREKKIYFLLSVLISQKNEHFCHSHLNQNYILVSFCLFPVRYGNKETKQIMEQAKKWNWNWKLLNWKKFFVHFFYLLSYLKQLIKH